MKFEEFPKIPRLNRELLKVTLENDDKAKGEV